MFCPTKRDSFLRGSSIHCIDNSFKECASVDADSKIYDSDHAYPLEDKRSIQNRISLLFVVNLIYVAKALKPRANVVIWLILPVVICLSQRLSHACVSISIIRRNCEWLITSVIVYLIIESYMDNRDKLQLIHALRSGPKIVIISIKPFLRDCDES